jgi:hypothetical protein
MLSKLSGFIRKSLQQTQEKQSAKENPSNLADQTRLFDGDDHMFQREIQSCQVYGEYGCGASTVWVAHHTKARIMAVDSSAEWIAKVALETEIFRERLRIEEVDLGKIAAWGYPTTYRHRSRFHDYVVSPWRHGVKPDLVLIDGRFRVASFLHSLLTAEPGTRLIFDDYNNRPHYHLVEEFCPVKEREGRQALFLVPDQLERPAIVAEEERFLYVRD